MASGASPLWAVSLVLIGLSPLLHCVILGEASHNLLLVMVAMHWGIMWLLPALFYAARVIADPAYGYATLDFYGRLARPQEPRLILRKMMRGMVIGVPVCLTFVVYYLLNRCRTARWALCVHNFQQPIGRYGFAPHSLTFRTLAALYFSFWNPVVEEFFWRVFLHREMGAALGVPAEEKTVEGEEETAAQEEVAPWSGLWRDVRGMCPGAAPSVRWGVSLLYASYHTWPVKVMLGRIWWPYAAISVCTLTLLGRTLLVMRENLCFGLPAAYVLHVWIDIAFALVALFEVHPNEVFGDG